MTGIATHLRAVKILPPTPLASRTGPRYLPGQVAWLPEREAKVAIDRGWAEAVDLENAVKKPIHPVPPLKKDLDAPPADRMVKVPPVKK